MASSIALKSALLVSVVAISAAATGCSNGAPPSDPEGQIAYVQDGIASPSGNVDATSMKNLGLKLSSVEGGATIFSSIGLISSGGACVTGSQTDGSVDLSCATSGGASGKMSFKIEGDVSGSTVSATASITFENACNADGSVCVTGTGAFKAEVAATGVQTDIAIDADITKDGAKTHFFFGEEAGVTSTGANAKIVLFDDKNDSYVFTASVSAEGISTSVEGGNGTFSCTIGSGAGNCTGDASFSF